MSKHALEMTRGNTVIHMIPNKDGTYTGDDVYNGKKKGLTFRNVHHLRSFATKYSYNVTRIQNT
jgi:hypothetical protein